MENEILEKLMSSKSPQEAEQIIEKYYPNWLVRSLEKYSPDYPHLQANWQRLCQEMKTEPRKIVLVNEIEFGDTPSTLNKICEYMTLHGYVVRRASEFTACSVCQKAIPCEEIWTLLKSKNLPVPKVWSERCTGCGN